MNYDGSKRSYYTVFLLRRQNQRKLTVITVWDSRCVITASSAQLEMHMAIKVTHLDRAGCFGIVAISLTCLFCPVTGRYTSSQDIKHVTCMFTMGHTSVCSLSAAVNTKTCIDISLHFFCQMSLYKILAVNICYNNCYYIECFRTAWQDEWSCWS